MTNDTADTPLLPDEAEFLSLLSRVQPVDMFAVIRELVAVAESVEATKH